MGINFISLCGQDGITQTEMYILLWILSVNFLCSHWEKYNTGIMYLPWGYDISQVTIFVCYIISATKGTTFFYDSHIFGLTLVQLLKFTLYAGSVFTIVISVKNVIHVWRNGTCKQTNLFESFRPWGPLAISMVVMYLWIYYLTPDLLNPLLIPLLFGAMFDGILHYVYLARINFKIV